MMHITLANNENKKKTIIFMCVLNKKKIQLLEEQEN